MIDLYCERVNPGLWDEPLNALTNLAFLVAAVFTWRHAKRAGAMTFEVMLLTGLMAAIGVGSGLFHTFATRWAWVLDVTPILLYQLAYIWTYGRRIMRLRTSLLLGLLALFFVAGYFTQQLRDLLNGSLMYLPALLFLLGFAVYHYRQSKQGPTLLFWACAALFGSLTFRTLDLLLCPYISFGTHFMWHLLNGLLLYLTARAVILNLPCGSDTGRQPA